MLDKKKIRKLQFKRLLALWKMFAMDDENEKYGNTPIEVVADKTADIIGEIDNIDKQLRELGVYINKYNEVIICLDH